MEIELVHTTRGFMRGEFIDRYRTPCSIQESSIATEPCIWLGTNESPMHLTPDMVRAMLPALQHFAEHGDLRIANGDLRIEPPSTIREEADRDYWQKPCIEQHMALSTIHLSAKAVEWLKHGANLNIASSNVGYGVGAPISTLGGTLCGWFVHVPTIRPDGMPQSLWNVFNYARARGVSYILFDADAPAAPDLVTWEDDA